MADELEHHLKERLGEAQDFADFSASRRAAQGSPEGETVTGGAGGPRGSEIVVEGAEHLSGRKVQDTFTRGGRAQPVVTPKKKDKLEHHLASRLKEVNDEMLTGGIGGADAALRAYQDLRKKLGGS